MNNLYYYIPGGLNMFYILINVFAVAIASFSGRLLKSFLPKKLIKCIMDVVAVCVLIMGIQGSIKSNNFIFMLISLVIGAIIGNGLDLDKKLAHLVEYLQSKVKDSSGFSMKGAITLIMLQNIGSIAILGPLNLGLSGSSDIMQFKIILDFITTFLFSATYGFIVILSGLVGLLMNTLIFLLSTSLSKILVPEVIENMSIVGSLIIVLLGIDMLEIKRFKIMDYLPALFIPILWYIIKQLLHL